MPLGNKTFFEVKRQESNKSRSTQPVFIKWQSFMAFVGGVIAISLLGLFSNWSGYELLVAPFGASTVLLFGAPESPLAQPRNLIFGNLLGAVSAVFFVSIFGTSPLVSGFAVASAIALGQRFRCLHPPAGAVALLGVLSNAPPLFILIPVLFGSLLLLIFAIVFHSICINKSDYPLHWF
tara:strand:- start:42 stop:578 length:537 start_codon:yes stop_codon:yes gene_type:complete